MDHIFWPKSQTLKIGTGCFWDFCSDQGVIDSCQEELPELLRMRGKASKDLLSAGGYEGIRNHSGMVNEQNSVYKSIFVNFPSMTVFV